MESVYVTSHDLEVQTGQVGDYERTNQRDYFNYKEAEFQTH